MTEPNGIRVLVVEDSASQAKKLRTVLESAGYVVETAADGSAGLAMFAAADYHVILSDVMMPGLTGYELCRRVKADPRGAAVAFVLLTSLGKPVDLIRGLECGADNYIYTPFQPDALLGRIQTILSHRAARAGAAAHHGDDVYFMGHKVTVGASKERILDYLGSTFDDFVESRHREYETALAREKQLARAETYRVREEMLRKEKESLGRMHAFLQSTLDAMAVRVAILDDAGSILAVNAEWRQTGSVDPLAGVHCPVGTNYLTGCDASVQDNTADAAAVAAGIRDVTAGRRSDFSRECPACGSLGKRWFNVRVTRFGEGEAVRVVVVHEDVSSRKAAEEQLLHEAYHDALTGLPNRALFTDSLGRSVARARRSPGFLFAVLFLDLDGFKVVNDSLGHTAGDHLLMGIGRRLEECVRGGDTVARLGGDEFAIVVNEIRDVADALRMAERVQQEIGLPFLVGGHEVFTSVSVGIAVSDARYERPVEILRDADTAMYRAKALGTSHHVVFDQAMHTNAMHRLKLESDLRRAIERNELRVHYQPIVEIATGRAVGFEALARWQHPERGLVSPAEFIPAAEDTGLIIPLDLWVIREAAERVRAWHARYPHLPPAHLSVNLSSKQFGQPNLLERLDAILEATGFEPTCLKLEVTESVIMGQPDAAADKLRQIRSRGVGLSMDDFGTGYSSLSYLHKFPFDTLKIDRSFVRRISSRGDNAEIVSTIVALAHNLGMRVVAEGVETPEQAERLRGLKCEFGQGFFYARPLDHEAAEAFLTAQYAPALCRST